MDNRAWGLLCCPSKPRRGVWFLLMLLGVDSAFMEAATC